MFIPRIYYPQALQLNHTIVLDKAVSHYLNNVLRLKNGEKLLLFNGEKGQYHATYLAEKKCAQAHIDSFEVVDNESPLQLHLGQAIARGDRMDFVIQKATELGVQIITPLISANVAFKLKADRLAQRMQHWQNIAISATEQCGRVQLPIISPPMEVRTWAAQDFSGLSLVFEPASEQKIKNLPLSKQIRFAIGPESGWQEQEIQAFCQHGFTPCYLGPRYLRTETAALTAVSLLQGTFGDIS